MSDPLIDYNYIFDNTTVAPDRSKSRVRRKQTHKEQFEAFHGANPFVYQLLCQFARKVKAAGIHRYGIKALLEQVRWHVTFETYQWEPGKFKLNNNYAPHFARLIMENEPDLHGFFHLRVLKAA